MLTRLSIRDFAIIDHLDLELDAGMIALTGETGAGKSILIEALGIALGGRATATDIRHGAKQAEISAHFDLGDAPGACAWFTAAKKPMPQHCEVHRIVTTAGRTKATISGERASMEELNELSGSLLQIHGQHLHQALLHKDTQRDILDDQSGLQSELASLGELHRQWSTLRERSEQLEQKREALAARLELLRYEVKELAALKLQPGEVELISEEQTRLAHIDSLKEASLSAFYALYESDEISVDQMLGEVIRSLELSLDRDRSLQEGLDLLLSAQAQIREGAEFLRRHGDALERDPARLHELDQRLATLHELSRKHKVAPESLHEKFSELEVKLQELDGPEWNLDQLKEATSAARTEYLALAETIRGRRLSNAARIGQAVSVAMQELAMKGGKFEIRVNPLAEDRAGPSGMDDISFWVSANPGQPAKPLTKVASGGELARIGLALQLIALDSMTTPSLIFDEVDSGIGGAVAEIVGRKLRKLGEQRQVFCITHLPQVAAQAHSHYQIRKTNSGDGVRVSIEKLSKVAREEEIARMLGGVQLTDQTRLHAREMIDRAQTAELDLI